MTNYDDEILSPFYAASYLGDALSTASKNLGDGVTEINNLNFKA
jgi:hypothetical protein